MEMGLTKPLAIRYNETMELNYENYQDYKYRASVTTTELTVEKTIALPKDITIEQASEIHKSNNFDTQQAFDYWVSQGGEVKCLVYDTNTRIAPDIVWLAVDETKTLPAELDYDFSQPRPDWFDVWNYEEGEIAEEPFFSYKHTYFVVFVEIVDNSNEEVITDYFYSNGNGTIDTRYCDSIYKSSNYVVV